MDYLVYAYLQKGDNKLAKEQYDYLKTIHEVYPVDFKEAYAIRAGIESTISQAVRVSDLRQARYFGLPKTNLQHLITAAAELALARRDADRYTMAERRRAHIIAPLAFAAMMYFVYGAGAEIGAA